jgi:hypothetical protein
VFSFPIFATFCQNNGFVFPQ